MNTDILNKIVQDGAIVRTQVGANGWESSIILSHSEDIIQINLIQEYYRMAVMAGDPISCKYFFEGKEYFFRGKVERVSIYEVPSAYIKIEEVGIFRNKRSSRRLDVRLGANVWEDNRERATYCIVNNLSVDSIGVISRDQLNIGSEVNVDILLEQDELLTVKGRVIRQRWTEGYFEVGIKVKDEDREGQGKLKKVVDRYKKSNEKLVEETLEKMIKEKGAAERTQTIMVVDDSDFIRLIIKKLLSLQGFSKIIEVTDGPQAINFAQKLKPEIIILDIILPTLNGNEAIDEIFKVSPDSKIIVVSTISNRKIIEEVKAKGVVEYLVKPFDNRQLIDIINDIS